MFSNLNCHVEFWMVPSLLSRSYTVYIYIYKEANIHYIYRLYYWITHIVFEQNSSTSNGRWYRCQVPCVLILCILILSVMKRSYIYVYIYINVYIHIYTLSRSVQNLECLVMFNVLIEIVPPNICYITIIIYHDIGWWSKPAGRRTNPHQPTLEKLRHLFWFLSCDVINTSESFAIYSKPYTATEIAELLWSHNRPFPGMNEHQLHPDQRHSWHLVGAVVMSCDVIGIGV